MKHLAFMAALSAVAVGCGDLPDPIVNGNSSSNGQTPTQTLKPEPPALTTKTSTFGYSSLPLRGSAQKNTTIIVDGGAAPTAIDVSATGNFCVDVALKSGQNNLKVYAQRISDGAQSDATNYKITFDASLSENDPEEEEPPRQTTGTVRDVAQRKGVSSTVPASAGGNSITDGNDDTYTSFESYPALYIDLGSTYSVQKIDVVFSAGSSTSGRYADEYSIMSSLQASPTMDGSNASGWSTVSSVAGSSGGNGDGGTDTFSFGTPISARWISLVVSHNATSIWSFDWGVEIAAIKVYAPEILTGGGGTGTIGPPTCENGN